MTEQFDNVAAAAGSSGRLTAPVEPLDRPVGAKESQSRESSFSGTATRSAPLDVAIVDTNPPLAPIAARFISKQNSAQGLSPASPRYCRHPDHDNNAGASFTTSVATAPATAKRSPIRVGYLFKQSSGSWQRKRWNQRWFVLDNDTGVFKYFRHESLPEAVPFRQDAHGVIHLKDPGASLVIQGDLPRNVPTPFCFTVCDGNRSFLLCADSNQEFREWTSAISAILSPRKTSTVNGSLPCSPSKRATTDSALNTVVALPHLVLTDVVESNNVSSPKPVVTTSAMRAYHEANTDVRPTLRQTLSGLLVLNALIVVVRFANVVWVYLALTIMNMFLVWVLFVQKPSTPPLFLTSGETVDGSLDSSPAEVIGFPTPSSPRVSGTASPRSDSPRKQTLPRLDKLPSAASFQPTKFLGVVNGAKVKAGDSVKMCPPAPAAFVTGCWTQISGTRFQVRQGPNYRKTKLKAPSEESLLDLVAVDIYRSPSKIDHIASIIDLGELKPENGPLDLFVVNCQVPSYQPSNPLWGEKQGNGEGFNFVCFFAISPSVREQLNQHEPAHQGVRLLKNFMHDNSSVRDRFKAIGIVVNPQEQKLGRTERHLLETYNGQPILTRPQHRFYRGDGYFEVDVDAHEFNFVARKGLVGVSEHFRNMVVDFGYVIEGQEDPELPEQILGAVRLCKIDVRQALEIA